MHEQNSETKELNSWLKKKQLKPRFRIMLSQGIIFRKLQDLSIRPPCWCPLSSHQHGGRAKQEKK